MSFSDLKNTRPPAGYVSEANFVEQVTQVGATAGTPKQIKFGSPANSLNGICSMDALGTLTILKSGPFVIKTRYRAGRVGAAGVSNIFFWIEASTNGGVSWAVTGNSVDVTLNVSTENKLFFDSTPSFLNAGTKLRSMFGRSTLGNDSGDLIASTPGPLLTTYGVLVSPSAQLTVFRDLGYLYL